MTDMERLEALNAHMAAQLAAIASTLASGHGAMDDRVQWAIQTAHETLAQQAIGLKGAEQAVLVFPTADIAGQFLGWLDGAGEQYYTEHAEIRDEPSSLIFAYNHEARRVLVTLSGDEDDQEGTV